MNDNAGSIVLIRPAFDASATPLGDVKKIRLRQEYINRRVKMKVVVRSFDYVLAAIPSSDVLTTIALRFDNDMFQNLDGNNSVYGPLHYSVGASDSTAAADGEFMFTFMNVYIQPLFQNTGNTQVLSTRTYDLGVVGSIPPNLSFSARLYTADGEYLDVQPQVEIILTLE